MPVTIDYAGQIVFITGGGRGIGLGITTSFAKAGATCVVTYNSQDPTVSLNKISEQFNVPIHVYHCPGENAARVNEVIELASTEVGEIDVVIANAGVGLWREAIKTTDDELDWVMKANFYAPMYLARGFVRHWLGLQVEVPEDAPNGITSGEKTASASSANGHPANGHTFNGLLPNGHSVDGESRANDGSDKPRLNLNLDKRILCVSSISGLVNMRPQKQFAYNASKAALTMACRTLSGEWAQYGVTVNTISPGYVSSDMINNPPPGEGAQWAAKWRDETPVYRFANPIEVGQMVVLMCSQEATTFMTGHDLVVDGGFTTY